METKQTYYQRNKERILAQRAEKYNQERETLLARSNEYYKQNREQRIEYARLNSKNNKDYRKRYMQQFNKNNRSNLRQRYNTDERYRLSVILRKRIYNALKGNKKSGNSMELLGCTIEEYKSYLEALFKPGMSWSNQGSVWHIDHIKPIFSFNLLIPEEQFAAFNYRNTQPLFVKENLSKSWKLIT